MNKELDSKQVLNELLVDLFNHILLLEERNLKNNDLKDLSMTEIHVIESIGKSDYKSMSEVAKRLMITVGTLTISVNRLVQKGYVSRQRSEKDRRVVLVDLTEKGQDAFEIHEDFHKKMIEKILKNTKIAEDELLIGSLQNVIEFFDQFKV
ncbi:NADH dehydrogenase I subunit C-D protein [Haloplasma contractile SSD-17B]|uniref:NADH dehydrogenase I subunit C-D protein n=2 Tax=Haloplasma TaxID=471824 RepID=U2EDC2_9MOLU|nr:NADH dehydrogenase I subunit C-D protein [Haloplasma contractile SSD-17B]